MLFTAQLSWKFIPAEPLLQTYIIKYYSNFGSTDVLMYAIILIWEAFFAI